MLSESPESSSKVSRRQSVGRAFERIKDAWKGKRLSAQPLSSTVAVAEESSSFKAPMVMKPIRSLPPTIEPDSNPQPDPLDHPSPRLSQSSYVHIRRTLTPHDRALMLCDKYGIDPADMGYLNQAASPEEISELVLSSNQDQAEAVLRVEKQIRMRVRYICHSCDALFVRSSTCAKCGHTRCRDCPRIPPRRSRKDKEDSRTKQAEEQTT